MPLRDLYKRERSPFGRIVEEPDELFHRIRKRPFAQNMNELARLDDNVGRNQKNTRRDVAKVETLMVRQDRYDVSRTEGPTGIFSLGLESAIKEYQDDRGLKKDGLITPRGETISSMISLARFDEVDGDEDGGDNEPNPPPTPPTPEPKPDLPTPGPSPDEGKPRPTPPKPPQKPDDLPKLPKDPRKGDCSDIEAALAEAEAVLSAAQQELDSVAAEKEALEESIAQALAILQSRQAKADDIQSQIDVLQAEQDKENRDRAIAKGIGKGIGNISGRRGGRAGAQILDGIGGALGPIIEERTDNFRGQKTDKQIQQQMAALINRLSTIQADIEAIEAEIAGPQAEITQLEVAINALQPNVDAASDRVDVLQAALEACQTA